MGFSVCGVLLPEITIVFFCSLPGVQDPNDSALVTSLS